MTQPPCFASSCGGRENRPPLPVGEVGQRIRGGARLGEGDDGAVPLLPAGASQERVSLGCPAAWETRAKTPASRCSPAPSARSRMRSRASLDRLDADFIAFAVGTAMPPATPERIVADLDRPRTDLDQWNTGLTGRPSSTTTCALSARSSFGVALVDAGYPGEADLVERSIRTAVTGCDPSTHPGAPPVTRRFSSRHRPLIAGDVPVTAHGTVTGIGQQPLPVWLHDDPRLMQQSFAHLAALEHVTVLPGHGPLLVR